MDRVTLKKELRKKLRAIRQELSPLEIEDKSQAIFRNWKNEFEKQLSSLEHLHLFLSMKERNEVDTEPEKRYLESNFPELKIVVPVVDELNSTLKHVWVSNVVELVKNKFGVPEPYAQTKIISPEKIDMVLVPLLGFDRKGNRLGYGKGFYDGFLSQTRNDCLKIGIAFSCAEVENEIPAEPHDIRLDYVVTEKEVIKF